MSYRMPYTALNPVELAFIREPFTASDAPRWVEFYRDRSRIAVV
ncbi:hypothetical protein [Natrinema hispanicum]|nr:hypothetical protein [Natrinema hispanicum]